MFLTQFDKKKRRLHEYVFGRSDFNMKNSLEKKMEIDDSLVCHLALQSHSPQKSAINHYLDELYDIHSPQNEGKEKSFIAKQTIPQASVLAIDEEHKDLKLPSRFRRVGIFTVSLMLLILGLCGIFSPAKQAMTSAFRSVMSQPQTVTRYETKNIEDIRENDEVLATDPETGEVVKCRVTQVFVNRADGIHRVTITSGNLQQTFGVTAEHPYFVIPRNDADASWNDLLNRAISFADSPEDEPETIFFITDQKGNEHIGCYVAAKNLRNGDLLVGPSGELSQVIGNFFEPHPERITTYNFEVEHGHNYFVLAQHEMTTSGNPPVLVHNMCAVNRNTTTNASSLPIVRQGTQGWKDAVQAIRKGGKVNVRVFNASEAKLLLQEALGNMNRYKQYTKKPYSIGYEMHQQFSGHEGRAITNDLQHLKWKNGSNGSGHIFFDKPN
jgi:hypothetical protein